MIHDPDEWPNYMDLDSQEDKIREQEWDVLVVYDGARWDAMKQVLEESDQFDDYTFEEYRTPTLGGTTMWTDEVWRGDYGDVTYISGNPQSENVRTYDDFGIKLEEHVGEFIHGFGASIFDGGAWDFAMGTSRPEALTEMGLDEDPPLVVHYLQPHVPWVGDISVHIPHGEYDSEKVNELTMEEQIPLFSASETDLVDTELLRAAYYENMVYAFEHSKKLIKEFSQKYDVVLTADHGSAVGPHQWGHGGPKQDCKRVVPWVEI